MPSADLSSSFNSFFNATTAFFAHLSDIRWAPFAMALGFLLAMQLCRAWAWRNVLHAAYPGERISFTHLSAAYLAGAGINAVIPAHAGDVTKVFLVKRQIPHSSYPAVTSSFLVQTVFDTTVGALVLAYAITRGLLPPLPRIPDLPAFEISFWADHPQTLLIVIGALLLSIAIGTYYLAHHVRRFWDRVKQGLVILGQPRRYLREVAAWQGAGWLCRFGAFWFFLEAFNPGGAGAQQALLVATLKGPSRTAVLSFSVGTQIAMAAWSIVLGFAAMLLVFRTTDWRGLIRQAEDDAAQEKAGAAASTSAAGTR